MSDNEVDPDGKPAHEPGSKLDYGKSQLYTHLYTYFPRALDATCGVSEFGARKYTRMGWATVSDGVERYTNALARHLRDEAKGEVIDKDSGLMHASQVAWNALARLEMMLIEEEKDEERAAS